MNIHFLPSQANFKEQLAHDAKRGRTEWTCPKSAVIGDLVYFIIMGEGVIAGGLVDSVPKRAPRAWGFPGRYSAKIRNVELLAAPVAIASLAHRFPGWGYPRYPRSYTTVASPLAEQIRDFVSFSESAIVDGAPQATTYSEGAARIAKIIQYERNRLARQQCIARWGTSCAACGMSFGEVYGPDFIGYIHVHHLEPVASRKESYLLNPGTDLRPLCPNCHAIAHRSDPPFTIAGIKEFIRNSRKRQGLLSALK